MAGHILFQSNGIWLLDNDEPNIPKIKPISVTGMDFHKSIRPVLWIFRIYAIELNNSRKTGCFRQIVQCFLTGFYVCFYLLGFVVLFSHFLTFKEEITEISYYFTVVIFAAICFLTYLVLNLKAHKLGILLQNINDVILHYDNGPRFCQIVFWALRVVIICLVGGTTGFMVQRFFEYNPSVSEPIFEQSFNSSLVLYQWPTKLADIFCYIWFATIAILYISYVCLYVAVIGSFSFLLASLKCQFGHYRNGMSIKEKSNQVSSFLHLHLLVANLIKSANGCYREILLIWSLAELICAVFAGRAANFNCLNDIRPKFVIALLLFSISFMFKIILTATANYRVMESLKEISYVDELSIQDLSPSSTALAVKIKLYIQHIYISSPAITGWGLFVVGKDVAVAVDEIQALSAIYEKDWTVIDEELRTYNIRIPLNDNRLEVNLQVTLPPEYPADSPPFYQLSAPWLKNSSRRLELSAELENIYWKNVGESILYLWIEKIGEFLQMLLDNIMDPDIGLENDSASADHDKSYQEIATAMYLADINEVYAEELPNIIHGEPITIKKSTFQAHLSPIVSAHQVSLILAKLKTDKKIANATHNMFAYRIYNEANKSFLQDCDDDGETHAGSRLLHLLQIVDVKNVLIIVSRWYGGVHLGPDRFRQINNCARNVLLQSGLIKDGIEKQSNSKSKGKK